MKNKKPNTSLLRILSLLILLLTVLSNSIKAQTCLPSGITLTTQSEIDSFPINYPGCTQVLGDLDIDEQLNNSITNLDGLSQITSVGGNFTLFFTEELTSLSALESLDSVGGGFFMVFNKGITNLEGLEGLFFGDYLSIHSNNALTDISALSYLTHLEGGISIGSNKNLPNLNGLHNLTYVGKQLEILSSDKITTLNELSNITAIGENLEISSNDSLLSLSGLNNITSVGADLIITKNDTITSLTGLDNLNTVGGKIRITSNRNLSTLNALSQLNAVNGSFELSNNDLLTDLTGLNMLTAFNGSIAIANNDQLVNFNGLDNLNTVAGSCFILNNSSLIDLSALNNLTTLNGVLSVRNNPLLSSLTGLNNIDPTTISKLTLDDSENLSTFEVQSICAYLAIPTNLFDISENATGCNSKLEITEACALVSYENVASDQIKIYPNPVSEKIEIVGLSAGRLKILDNFGRIVQQAIFTNDPVDVSTLTNGLYIIQVQVGNQLFTKKMIKI